MLFRHGRELALRPGHDEAIAISPLCRARWKVSEYALAEQTPCHLANGFRAATQEDTTLTAPRLGTIGRQPQAGRRQRRIEVVWPDELCRFLFWVIKPKTLKRKPPPCSFCFRTRTLSVFNRGLRPRDLGAILVLQRGLSYLAANDHDCSFQVHCPRDDAGVD